MNIKRAKEEIEHTVKAYLAKDALGEYAIAAIGQRAKGRNRNAHVYTS